jgi:hypothetical protein
VILGGQGLSQILTPRIRIRRKASSLNKLTPYPKKWELILVTMLSLYWVLPRSPGLINQLSVNVDMVPLSSQKIIFLHYCYNL